MTSKATLPFTVSDAVSIRQRGRSTPHNLSRRDHKDTCGIHRSRVERSYPWPVRAGGTPPYAISYSPSNNSKQRQTLSAHCSLPSKSCDFRAFSSDRNRKNGLFHQKSGRNSCPCHWADYAHLKNMEECYDLQNAKSRDISGPYRPVGQDRPVQPPDQFSHQRTLLRGHAAVLPIPLGAIPLQKLAYINGKHLTAYVLYMQERGKSVSTIKTDLVAIRFSTISWSGQNTATACPKYSRYPAC